MSFSGFALKHCRYHVIHSDTGSQQDASEAPAAEHAVPTTVEPAGGSAAAGEEHVQPEAPAETQPEAAAETEAAVAKAKEEAAAEKEAALRKAKEEAAAESEAKVMQAKEEAAAEKETALTKAQDFSSVAT